MRVERECVHSSPHETLGQYSHSKENLLSNVTLGNSRLEGNSTQMSYSIRKNSVMIYYSLSNYESHFVNVMNL